VLTVRGGTIERREVKLGLESADRVEVVAGLEPDALVVVGNRSQLRSGARVTPKIEAAVAPARKEP